MEFEEISYSTVDLSYERATIIPPEMFSDLYPIMVLTIEFSKREEIIKVKYFQFEDLISTIGGTFGLIVTFLRILSYEVSKFPLKARILNRLFKFYSVENSNEITISHRQSQSINEKESVEEKTSKLKVKIEALNLRKIKEKISSFDFYKLRLKQLFNSKGLTIKDKNILLLENYVDSSLNITNISRIPYYLTQFSNITLGKEHSKLIEPEEFNINSSSINETLKDINDSIFDNNIKYTSKNECFSLFEVQNRILSKNDLLLSKLEMSNKDN